MKKNNNWIKMGFKVCKFVIIILLIIGCILFSSSKDRAYETEKFSFNKSLGVKATVLKEQEEEPKPVVEEKPVVLEKKTETKKTTVKEKNNYSVSIKEDTPTSGTKLSGILTGYGADCPKCGGTLACKSSYRVKNNGVVTYPDSTYGNVRIVASSKNLKCGSIVKFNLKKMSSEPIYAIVLDRGVLGNNLDLLMASEADAAKKVGRNNITYEVVRTGW